MLKRTPIVGFVIAAFYLQALSNWATYPGTAAGSIGYAIGGFGMATLISAAIFRAAYGRWPFKEADA